VGHCAGQGWSTGCERRAQELGLISLGKAEWREPLLLSAGGL